MEFLSYRAQDTRRPTLIEALSPAARSASLGCGGTACQAAARSVHDLMYPSRPRGLLPVLRAYRATGGSTPPYFLEQKLARPCEDVGEWSDCRVPE
jgi:hypothetical protein